MSQPATTGIPSRSGPLGIFVGGLILLVIAALSTWVLPQVLVFNQQMQSMEVVMGPGDYYDGQSQSGQPTDIPEGFMVTVWPENMPANWDPMSNEPPPMPNCTVEGPSGSVETIDMYGQLAFETLESGSHTIDCEVGGNLWLSGQKADIFHEQESWNRTITILWWTALISLIAGVLLSVIGAYLLGERNVQRKIALDRVYADVPGVAPAVIASAPAGAPPAPGAPADPAGGAGPVAPAAPADHAASAATGQEQPPAPPQQSLPPITRPKNSRQSRDPFAD